GSWNWLNTGLFINGSLPNYSTQGSSATSSSLTAQNYKDALVSVNDANGNVASSITTAISNFKAEGATFISYGMEMANNVFANNSATYTKDDGTEGTRKRIVVVFTDGAPGYSGYTDAEAGAAVNYSYTAKNTYSATVYTVGLYASSDETTNVKNFMNYLSSNYPSAQYNTSNSSWSAGTQASSKYYMTTNDATELNNIFQSISTDVSSDSTTVTLDANSVMKDIMGDGFTLADDFNVDTDVIIKTYKGSVNAETGDIDWGNVTTNSASASVNGKTVSVTGFNYAEKYISSGHEGEKICVTIKGVLPTESVTTDVAVNTNAATSGIYADSETDTPAATFPQPQTIITKKLYVLDYAKEAELTGLDQDTSITSVVKSYQAVSSSDSKTLTLTYGTSALATALTYTPTTMSWNGYDSLYVFGKTTDESVTALEANKNGNLWSKVSVIPANNVYYEDDFVTTYTDETKTETATVGIVYTGSWSTVGESSGNTETANNDTYGWVESLSDDATYSDGSATASGSAGATATFTFTGTGVDIYSRTDMVSGMVIVQVKSADESTNVSKTFICNDLSTTAVYYQIPTVCFEMEQYGTYTVTITVATNGSTDTENYTYYLDGVRVYNPLGETVTGDANEAYAADNELNAVFTEVRDLLITANSFNAAGVLTEENAGVVFIDDLDSDTKTTDSTSDIGTYKSYGPENEVYLAAGQSIAFKVSGGDHYYLGLKAPSGNSTTATVTNGTDTSDLTISSASDLYYEITPNSDGIIMVKNNGSNLLSITKLRSTSADTSASGIALLSADEVEDILVYAASFDSLATVAYTDTGVEEDSFVDTETDTDTEADADTGDTYEDLDEDDIVIDNPTEDTEEETEETEDNSQQSIFSNLFNSIRNWFNGRR
ncbi:MAG: hypothetical protein LUH16_00170, partial [Clostridiales bacterium]|nr:hypothetical protein [Clostridiales bacterium]